MKRFQALLVFASCIVLIVQLCAIAQKRATRPFTPDDLSHLESLATSLSPDGELLVYRRWSGSHTLGNLWVVHTNDGHRQQVTSGSYPDFGLGLVWSPDSQRLALITGNGPQEQIQVWERTSGRLRELTPFYPLPDNFRRLSSKAQWVSNTQLAGLLPPIEG